MVTTTLLIIFTYNKPNKKMLIVEVRHGKIEKALKMMRRKTIKTKLLPTLRKNRNYIKKSQRRREEMQKAKYLQRKSDQED